MCVLIDEKLFLCCSGANLAKLAFINKSTMRYCVLILLICVIVILFVLTVAATTAAAAMVATLLMTAKYIVLSRQQRSGQVTMKGRRPCYGTGSK